MNAAAKRRKNKARGVSPGKTVRRASPEGAKETDADDASLASAPSGVIQTTAVLDFF